jgi:exodeoxyribonuclease V alpha subunit
MTSDLIIAQTAETLPYSRLDLAFAQFLSSRTSLKTPQKKLFNSVVSELSYQHNQGHSCIVLDEDKRSLVLASGLAVSATLAEVTPLPLVVEENRLYLQRYWSYENRLMLQIKAIAQQQQHIDHLDSLLANLGLNDAQQYRAAQLAVQQHFSIITGGPGTGKTTTIVKILAALQQSSKSPLQIALAAPTGKAAMRLQQSIGNQKQTLTCSDDIKAAIPETVTTLHRLLGAKHDSPYFKHHAGHPLIHDVVVVDEVSMVDLALMSKLLDALKPAARLILLGDKDQLASVESGAVLADLTQALPEHTVELITTHRFNSHIKQLAIAVNQQKSELAWQCLTANHAETQRLNGDLISYIATQQLDYLALIKQGKSVPEIFQAFNRFQVLCANREGKNSVADINERVTQKLAQQGLIRRSGAWYVGRPVLITQNNPSLHLYNGDIGLCLLADDKLLVFFQRPDGSIKSYLPSRLSQCETVFAMTIHKSQGSEFDDILIVLPDMFNPVLTKELLYTAITRAKKTVNIVADKTIFTATVQQKVARVTGLIAKFRN